MKYKCDENTLTVATSQNNHACNSIVAIMVVSLDWTKEASQRGRSAIVVKIATQDALLLSISDL